MIGIINEKNDDITAISNGFNDFNLSFMVLILIA